MGDLRSFAEESLLWHFSLEVCCPRGGYSSWISNVTRLCPGTAFHFAGLSSPGKCRATEPSAFEEVWPDQ